MIPGPDQIWLDYYLVYKETHHYFTGRAWFVFDSDTALIPQADGVAHIEKAIIFNIISGWRRQCVRYCAKRDKTLENAVIQQFTNAKVAFNILMVCSEHNTVVCARVGVCVLMLLQYNRQCFNRMMMYYIT